MSALANRGATGSSSQDAAKIQEQTEKPDLIDPFYHQDIWRNMVEQDLERAPLTLSSPQLAFRGSMVRQIQDLAKRLNLSTATVHSAVALLDSFMAGHVIRADRMSHVVLACLSLAGKCEEKYSYILSLNVMSELSGIAINGKAFRMVEWMIGQDAQWKLITPTSVTFAYLLTQFLVTDDDLPIKNPQLKEQLQSRAGTLLNSYLDLILSDITLKLLRSVYVGCACIAATRNDLNLISWPPALEAYTGKTYSSIASISTRLQRMMMMVNARRPSEDSDADQGYVSLDPLDIPLNVLPQFQSIPVTRSSSGSCTSYSYVTVQAAHYQRAVDKVMREKIKFNNAVNPPQPAVDYPYPLNMVVNRQNDPTDPLYYATRQLVTPNANVEPSTSAGVKRHNLSNNEDFENKRMRVRANLYHYF